MLRFLCCFMAFLQVGWSANDYLIESIQQAKLVSHHTQRVILQPQYRIQQQHSVPTIFVKEFYYFAAPDDKIEAEVLKKLLASPKEHQQVIFIKSPKNPNYEKVLQNLLQNTVQQNTQIYVLQKEPNYIALQQKFLPSQNSVNHKPEVHFIKYRNPLEAELLQSSIIQQYGGNSGSVKNIVTNRNFEIQHRGTNTKKYVQTRTLLPDNTPVSKNYAINYLPTGVDVVPGSSYIPLVKK